MEQVLEINSSFSLFKDFSEIKNLNIINAGITSYSPTLIITVSNIKETLELYLKQLLYILIKQILEMKFVI